MNVKSKKQKKVDKKPKGFTFLMISQENFLDTKRRNCYPIESQNLKIHSIWTSYC